MIIQKVLKGISKLDVNDVDKIFSAGIQSNWVREQRGKINLDDVPARLTQRNLDWHQNHYDESDPLFSNQAFSKNTPFISTTAGSVERSTLWKKNTLTPAWFEALRFATNFWKNDGWIFECYLFVLGRQAVELPQFAEELRELHVYMGYSAYQPEGEVTAKLYIPPTQIRVAYSFRIKDIDNGKFQTSMYKENVLYQEPEKFHNIRGYL